MVERGARVLGGLFGLIVVRLIIDGSAAEGFIAYLLAYNYIENRQKEEAE